ncbi:hypothetical protein [Roseinatronobacter ekhonensis]|uniref:hypothetical protein n=1 Tax=Roseinatronobacter ekhonensis TaxID=254356 RepID=UPI0011C48336|nr:hypothetical protein [Roseibaca ekhonensis]
MKIAAIAAAGFYRAGQFWPHEGIVIDPDTLEPDVMERLRAEPRLHVEPAPDGETATEVVQADDALRARIKAAIGDLPADAFGSDGAPNLTPLRRALPEDAKRITAGLRDEIWADLKPAQQD